MRVIIIIVAILIVFGIISAIIDFIKDNSSAILKILACVIIAGASCFLYAKKDYPIIMLLVMGIIFLIANIIAFLVYLVKKHKYKKIYEWALEFAKEINIKKEEITKRLDAELYKTMSDCLMENGMGTDQEIWEEVKEKYKDVDEINEKINLLVNQLVMNCCGAGDINEIRKAEKSVELLKMFKEKIPILVENGDYIINCNLNGDKKSKSWDGKLYKSSRISGETIGKNMLPTERITDID